MWEKLEMMNRVDVEAPETQEDFDCKVVNNDCNITTKQRLVDYNSISK